MSNAVVQPLKDFMKILKEFFTKKVETYSWNVGEEIHKTGAHLNIEYLKASKQQFLSELASDKSNSEKLVASALESIAAVIKSVNFG